MSASSVLRGVLRLFAGRSKARARGGRQHAASPPALRVHRPVFLVGTVRSGTTLLANLLGRSPLVAHCPFELKEVWSRCGVPMASARTRDLACPECGAADAAPGMRELLTAEFETRLSLLAGRAPGAFFLNKNPHLCNKLPLVKELFPDARIIWVHRDLVPVVASIKRLFTNVNRRQSAWHWWPPEQAGVRNRCWNALFSSEALAGVPAERVFPGGGVRFIAEYWLESNRAVAEFFAALPPGESIAQSEEALIASPVQEVERLLRFLGIAHRADPSLAARLDPRRNSQWRELLVPGELDELVEFVRRRGGDIDAVFPGESRPGRYLEELEGCAGAAGGRCDG